MNPRPTVFKINFEHFKHLTNGHIIIEPELSRERKRVIYYPLIKLLTNICRTSRRRRLAFSWATVRICWLNILLPATQPLTDGIYKKTNTLFRQKQR